MAEVVGTFIDQYGVTHAVARHRRERLKLVCGEVLTRVSASHVLKNQYKNRVVNCIWCLACTTSDVNDEDEEDEP